MFFIKDSSRDAGYVLGLVLLVADTVYTCTARIFGDEIYLNTIFSYFLTSKFSPILHREFV